MGMLIPIGVVVVVLVDDHYEPGIRYVKKHINYDDDGEDSFKEPVKNLFCFAVFDFHQVKLTNSRLLPKCRTKPNSSSQVLQ